MSSEHPPIATSSNAKTALVKQTSKANLKTGPEKPQTKAVASAKPLKETTKTKAKKTAPQKPSTPQKSKPPADSSRTNGPSLPIVTPKQPSRTFLMLRQIKALTIEQKVLEREISRSFATIHEFYSEEMQWEEPLDQLDKLRFQLETDFRTYRGAAHLEINQLRSQFESLKASISDPNYLEIHSVDFVGKILMDFSDKLDVSKLENQRKLFYLKREAVELRQGLADFQLND